MDSVKYMVTITVGRSSFSNQHEVFVFATSPEDAIENVKILIMDLGGQPNDATFEAEVD